MISSNERAALSSLRFNPAPTPDDVWRPSPYDVPELHERVVAEILTGVNRARHDDIDKPLGVAMQGRAGSGKTHLLGAVRAKIQDQPGFFFLVNVINGRTFWENTALCIIEGLGKPAPGWETQLIAFLRQLTSQMGLPVALRDALCGAASLSRQHLDQFIDALRRVDREVGRDCQDTARALALLGSRDFDAQDVGLAHLISEPGEPADRAAWGLKSGIRVPQQIVRDISRLMALTLEPTVIAIDQLDTLLAQTSTALFSRNENVDEGQAKVIAPIADGLLNLREITRRTLVVMSCLPDTWELLKRYGAAPAIERFRDAVLHDRILNPDIGREIIAKRFATKFAEQRFSAPYPTWPIKPEAFADAPNLTPRALLIRAERHVMRCLDVDDVIELDRLVDGDSIVVAPADAVATPVGESDIRSLDDRFEELVAAADIADALDPKLEDAYMPALLAAGLAAWIDEHAPTGAIFKHDAPPSRKPALHARLIEVLDEATENEAHWGFRAIASTNAISVISRVKAACTMAGLDMDIPQRRLVILRNHPWPTGKRSTEIHEALLAAGGVVRSVSERDLRVFAAVKAMRATPDAHLQEWLVHRRPASNTELLRDVLGEVAAESADSASKPADTASEDDAQAQTPVGSLTPGGLIESDASSVGAAANSIDLGYTADGTQSFNVNMESLRRHTVIFAGSGSGKTVLIRRLVEACALHGVSAIVLDPNNDLARLGDPWPDAPGGWGPGDDALAREYLDNTDVVIWTPRVLSGRPLAFQPLPDFGPVRDSADEFDQAIRSAVEALAPRAGVNGATRLAKQGNAVLTEALQAYAAGGGVGLRGFTEFLADLPDGVSRMAKAAKLAHEVAETLKAAMVTDPLFGGDGAAADPGVLLTPPPGKRARVSVISFVGLTSDEQRQSFVNQLQMALFNWIKRHPAGERPLGGLFVMDEAQTLAPSSGKTPCTASSIALASQARKYGLGLVFATQAPKGLHNQISGNATTQFFGLLNAPAQIDAARELAQAKGGSLPDIGLLSSGQFYAAGEGFSFVKVRTPLCLSYHPKAPLSPEDVIERAARRS